MLVFPQLTTGAVTTYPVIKRSRARSVVNELADGRRVAYSDLDGGGQEWDLHVTGITATEWAAIEALHHAARGRFDTFLFLDPTANLVAHSEEFGEAAWNRGPFLALTEGVADPYGTSRATGVVNSGTAAQRLWQILPVPGDFQYAIGVWVRAQVVTEVTLIAESGTQSSAVVAQAGTAWRRLAVPVALDSTESNITFAVEVPAGASLELFGFQIEAQLGLGDYKKTGSTSGTISKARFADDELTCLARATDVFDAVVRIVSVRD